VTKDPNDASLSKPRVRGGIRGWLAARRARSADGAPHCADETAYSAQGAANLRALARRPTSLTLRHLDCGSCNGCEQQLIALANPCYDMEAYGIAFEASPRHAVYLAMTGPFTRGLAVAAQRTLEAMPEPRIIAVGDCAAGGGPFADCYGLVTPRPVAFAPPRDGVPVPGSRIEKRVIAGCPPTPAAILEKLAALVAEQRRGGKD